MHHFITEENIETNLTGRDRQRLISARSRNYGFIDKAFDIGRDNPDFLPPHFNIEQLWLELRTLEDLRQLMLVLQQFLQLVTNCFMQQADLCYRDALRIYGSLQEQTRARVPGAAPLFEALQDFFRRRRRPGEEPTEKELERDIKRLLHGTADGEIVIENVSPKVSGGVHRVVDNVHKGKTVIKETEEAVIDEGITTKRK
jgi:AcrR family transcriptional regulator